MKNLSRPAAAFILVFALIVALTACGSSSANTALLSQKSVSAETAAFAEYAAENYDAEMSSGINDTASALVSDPGRKLIKTVSLTMETKSMEESLKSITARVGELEGYIQSSDISMPSEEDLSNPCYYSYLTIRIPTDKLDEFIADAQSAGNITNKSEYVEDITLQYSDTTAHKESLLIEQERLNDLLKKADTVEDMIAIESQLSQVRYELTSIESQLRTYDNRVDYSTVNISISQVSSYTTPRKESFASRVSAGFKNTLEGLGVFLEDAAVFILSFSPVLIIIAAIVTVIVIIIKKTRKKKENKSSPDQQQ